MMRLIPALASIAVLVGVAPAIAAPMKAAVYLATATGPGESLGIVTAAKSAKGVVLKVKLHGLPPGEHGLHVHANGSCAPGYKDGMTVPAGGAGGHLDPSKAGMHMGPEGAGHLGDLPRLVVAADGAATATLMAPHIPSLASLKGHALMIHAGGDNYSDQPKPLGGGGARIACGVFDDQ